MTELLSLVVNLKHLKDTIIADILEPLQSGVRTSYEATLVIEGYLSGLDRAIEIAESAAKELKNRDENRVENENQHD